VYEREQGVFFYDRSTTIPKDATLHQLLCHPKTLVTPHQAFATNEALQNIALATFENLNSWENGKHAINELS
jgi:D-lactate dehydrogenase